MVYTNNNNLIYNYIYSNRGLNCGDNMEKEIDNIYFATKDLEEYYKLKKCILNALVWDDTDAKAEKYYKTYVKMMFNAYEKKIFCIKN